jgi:hypothetical protein
MLNINYSTAKTILRIFRIEKRIEKKNADEERELKEIIYKFRKDKVDETTKSTDENRETSNLQEFALLNQSEGNLFNLFFTV